MMATARTDVAEEAEAEGNMASGPEAAASTEEDEGSGDPTNNLHRHIK